MYCYPLKDIGNSSTLLAAANFVKKAMQTTPWRSPDRVATAL